MKKAAATARVLATVAGLAIAGCAGLGVGTVAGTAAPKSEMALLVQRITADASTDEARARAVHDWIARNIAYDTESYFSGRTKPMDADSVLKRRTAVCAGYSDLFTRMGTLAHLECVTVTGYGRGYSFDVFDEKRTENHAWNAVKIGGKWRLLDCTWDAGFVDAGGAFHAEYNTGYLFPEPFDFLHTHFPAAPGWQLLDKPVSARDFEALPYLSGRFFASGLKLKSPLKKVNVMRGAAEVRVAAPADVGVGAMKVKRRGSPEGFVGLDYTTSVVTEGAERVLRVSFSEQGQYLVTLFVTPAGSEVGTSVAELAFDVKAKSDSLYPIETSFRPKLGAILLTSVKDLVPARGQVAFKLSAPQDVALRVDLKIMKSDKAVAYRSLLEPGPGGAASCLLSFPGPGTYVAHVYATTGDNHYYHVFSIPFVASEGSPELFPDFDMDYARLGCRLIQPLRGPLRAGAPAAFEVIAHGVEGISVNTGGKLNALTATGDDRYTGTVTPVGETAEVYYKSGNTYRRLAVFPVAGR